MDRKQQGQLTSVKLMVEIINACVSRLRSEALLDFEGYNRRTDNHFIFALVAIGNTIGNSQTEKQISKTYFQI